MSLTKKINDADALLIYRVGPVLCCSPSVSVVSVMLPPNLHKPPGTGLNPGVFRHSNGLVQVIDLRQRFGVDEAQWKLPGRVIVSEISGGLAGFMVDDVDDVTQWPEQGWGALPALVPRKVFKRTLLLNQAIYLYADFEDLMRCADNGYLREHITQILHLQKPMAASAQTAQPRTTTPLSDTSERVPQPPPVQPPAQSLVKDIDADLLPTAIADLRPYPPETKPQLKTAVTKAQSKTHAAVPVGRNEQKAAPPLLPVTAAITVCAKATQETSLSDHKIDFTTQQSPPVVAKPDAANAWIKYAVIIVLLLSLMAVPWLLTDTQQTEQTAQPKPAAINNQHETIVQQQIPEAPGQLQASIAADDEGLVIIVDTEDDEVAEDNILAVNRQALDKAKINPTEKIIVHIVVKGDTLWGIANKYVRDPWRYPELAKLSNIKNPHRIYPGNKVKIIKRITGKKIHVDSKR